MLRPQERPDRLANVGNPTTTVGLYRNNDKHDPSRCRVLRHLERQQNPMLTQKLWTLWRQIHIAEPASVPSATASLKDKNRWIQAVPPKQNHTDGNDSNIEKRWRQWNNLNRCQCQTMDDIYKECIFPMAIDTRNKTCVTPGRF